MDDQERTLAHTGLNAAMMAAFALKNGKGRPAGIALAFAVSFFDVLCPKQPPQLVDKAILNDLKTALTGLQNDVIDAIWKGKAKVIGANVLSLTTGFYNVWGGLSSLQVDTKRCILTNLKEDVEQFKAAKYKYFDTLNPNGVLATLRTYRNTLQLTSENDDGVTAVQVAEHRTRTIGLYGLIGSLTAAYLKGAVAWIWGQELLLAWQYSEYQQALLDFNNGDAAYQNANPLSGILQKYLGVDANPYYSPPDWNTWIDLPGSPMHLLVNEVQDMLNYCVTIPAKGGQKEQPGLYTRMWSDLCDFDQKVASFDVALPSNGKMTKAQMIQAVEQGAARSGWWETLSEKNASLAHVAEDDIVTFGKTIDQWRAVAASVRFKTYVTVDGDTLESIAQTYYGSGSFTQNLFDANKAIFTPANPKKTKNGNEVVAGTLLKIFETDALPYVVN